MFAALGPWLWAFILTIVVPLVEKVLILLGVGWVIYQGVDVALEELKTQLTGYLGGLPADLIGILGIMKVDMAFSLVLSAIALKFTLMGVNSAGKTKKMVFKA